MDLMWATLVYPTPTANPLKPKEAIQDYFFVTTRSHHDLRDTFTHRCLKILSEASVDESSTSKTLALFLRLLQSSPVNQVVEFVESSSTNVPSLLFGETIEFLKRSASTTSASSKKYQAQNFSQRLTILRFVYGQSSKVNIDFDQLQECWKLTSSMPKLRGELLSFISDAAGFDCYLTTSHLDPTFGLVSFPFTGTDDDFSSLKPAFDVRVCATVFKSLICKGFGKEGNSVSVKVYDSIKKIIDGLDDNKGSTESEESLVKEFRELLWSIALNSESDEVVDSAGSRLLNIYSQSDGVTDFVDKVFRAMEKPGKSTPHAPMVNRCMKLLTSAMDCGLESQYETIIYRLNIMDETNCRAVVSSVPHGLKSAACKKSVTVELKRLDQSAASRNTPPPSFNLLLHPLETLESVVRKVAGISGVPFNLFKPINATGKRSKPNMNNQAIANLPYHTTMSELYVTDGTKFMFLVRPQPDKNPPNLGQKYNCKSDGLDVNEFFGETKSSAKRFSVLLNNLEQLGDEEGGKEAKSLTWDFLRSIQTNHTIVMQVKTAAGLGFSESEGDNWATLLSPKTLHKSVYTMQVIDFLLQPSSELGNDTVASKVLMKEFADFAGSFKKGFIDTGGFTALLNFFIGDGERSSELGMGNAIALRVLKFCLFGDVMENKVKNSLLKNIKDPTPFLKKLAMATLGNGQENSLSISNDSVILDAVEMLRLLLLSSQSLVSTFVKLKGNLAENLVMKLLLKAGGRGSGGAKIRETMHNLIIDVEVLGIVGFPWFLKCLSGLGVEEDNVSEFFNVLKKLVRGNIVKSSDGKEKMVGPSPKQLADLGTRACKKLIELEVGTNAVRNPAVLNGCLSLIRRLLETKVEGGGIACLKEGCNSIAKAREGKALMSRLASKVERISLKAKGGAGSLSSLVELIFHDFLFAIGGKGKKPVCMNEESRKLAFFVLQACARADAGGTLVNMIIEKIGGMVDEGEAGLRNKYGFMVSSDGKSEGMMSGLRNQGCTCYMNSLLQQLFMMKDLRESLCDAPISKKLRGGVGVGIGDEGGKAMVGKRIIMFWETGGSFGCKVAKYDDKTGMHTIVYDVQKTPRETGGGMGGYGNYHQRSPVVSNEDMARAWNLEESDVELILSEGRPGRETGNFQLLKGGDKGRGGGGGQGGGEESGESEGNKEKGDGGEEEDEVEVEETEEERKSRRMLEELQKTFVHLSKSQKRYYDPRSLVEASDCLRLEYDVWQQNDASEYQTKLLDSLEIALKKHAPSHCKYLTDKFRMGITKQKICKECGLKTNREEVVVNLEGPVRGRSEILELIEGYCSEELMDGDNKVNCDACDKKTDTILRTCISKLPNVLTVSLKRFDLDYTTFETVKLNSRMEFGTTLNMKKYTLDGFELLDKFKEEMKEKEGGRDGEGDGDDEKDVEDSTDNEVADTSAVVDPLEGLSDAGYEYKLSGVLVHAGVAQGGHYYSYIKDRETETWYKFDDDDVTPFDLANLEAECFGGKMVKENKWPNGTVNNNIETERYANALMLFYEKVEDDAELGGKGEKGEEGKKKDVEEEEGVASDGITGKESFEALVQKDNDTHIRYSYLFDSELSNFLRNVVLLGTQQQNNWGTDVTKAAITFFFNVFLHGTTTTKSLKAWGDIIVKGLTTNEEICVWFCTELAKKTKGVSGNWLKQVAGDCIDSGCRETGLKMIAFGIRSCIESSKTEESKLTVWTESWKKQTSGMIMKDTKEAIPTTLTGGMAQFENWETAGSSVGVLLGFVNQLLEEFVMYSKDGIEFLNFVSELTKTEGIREGLVSSHATGRVATLLMREASPPPMKEAYPGCCLNADAVELMRGGGIGGVGAHGQTLGYSPGGMTGIGMGGDEDMHAALLGLFGGLAKAKGSHKAPISVNGEITENAKAAFTDMWEICRDGKVGMDMKSIETCMRLCGVDLNTVHSYQISNILNKYDTVTGKGGDKCLTLAGFLKYHKETVVTNENQLRNDLAVFGYRRDLTKREGVVISKVDGGDLELDLGVYEAAAIDAGKVAGVELGDLTDIGLMEPTLWSTCFRLDEGLTASILSACFVGKGGTALINNLLVELLDNLGQWR